MKLPVLKFDKDGLIPAIIQDAATKDVLMMAYMNRESVEKTVSTGHTHFWSRSRGKLWKKGETSGHVQKVREILYDCDGDTLLIKVDQKGPGACHTGHRSCFFTDIDGREVEGKTFSAEAVYGKK
jgi:phosphoribosyl-AMP cyclohydrolase